MKNLHDLKRAMLIGGVATFMMTVASLLSHHFHLPRTDFLGMVGTFMKVEGMGAWVMYFGAGMFGAYCFHRYFRNMLPDRSWRRGLYYALCLFAFIGIFMMPAVGMGLFAGSMKAAFGMFFALAFYGACTGYLYDHS